MAVVSVSRRRPPRGSVNAVRSWRDRLVDFSERNPLLYFDLARGTRLRIVGPSADRLYKDLVIREKALRFPLPAAEPEGDATVPPLPVGGAPTGSGPDQLHDHPVVASSSQREAVGVPPAQERGGHLAVDYEASSARDVVQLQRALSRLARRQREAQEERGVNTLHLALGILAWREAPQEHGMHRAPLLMVRVILSQKSRADAYELFAEEGDVTLNPAIEQFLKHQENIVLSPPEPNDDWKPSSYLSRIGSTVASRGFTVSDEVWLGHFSFEKLAMWEDLGKPEVPKAVFDHPVLGPAVTGRPYEPAGVPPDDVQAAFELPQTYPVLDADHSQIEVLAQVRTGTSLVVEGPPGTGKSQTIVNIIAEALRDRKTVLFVSQKRAALEVVLKRLNEVGLDHLCLDLHSHKASPRQLVAVLERRLEKALRNLGGDKNLLLQFEERVQRREKLDAYVRELHRPRGQAGYTAYQVHGEMARLASVPDLGPVREWTRSALELSQKEERQLCEDLRRIHATDLWERAPNHPWRGAVLRQPFPSLRHDIEEILGQLGRTLTSVTALNAHLAEQLGPEVKGSTLHHLQAVGKALRLLAEPPELLLPEWLTCTPDEAEKAAGHAERVAALLEDRADALRGLRDAGCRALLDHGPEVRDLLDSYRTTHASRLRWLSRAYRADARRLAALAGQRLRYRDALRVLETSVRYLDDEAAHSELVSRLGMLAPNPPENPGWWRQMAEGLCWAGQLARELGKGLSAESAARVAHLHQDGLLQSLARQRADEAAGISESLPELLARIADLFPEGLNGQPPERLPLNELENRHRGWANHLAELDEWDAFQKAEATAHGDGLGPFLEAAREAQVASRQLEAAFVKFLRQRWLKEVYRQVPGLGQFRRKEHERVLAEFATLDAELCKLAAQVAARTAWQRQQPVRIAEQFMSVRGRPGAGRQDQTEEVAALKGEIRILRKEAKKKRRHLPLRRLLPWLPNLVRLLTPCVMASPLAIASYLPREAWSFDLVLVDEASQLRPEDAVGSILRARQAAVFGDSKQMPPSSFFERILEDGDETEDEGSDGASEATAFESVLDFLAPVIPRQRLRWHYRSRDERLIAFSNNHFYGDAPLMTFPAPVREATAEDTGVRLILVENGLWEQRVRRNLREAERVVELIVDHLRGQPERSLGVIALGLGQAETIEELLDRRLRSDRHLDAAAQQADLFVKNLENVQGDERDEIIISIGYAPTMPGGPVLLRFGPLNLEGGERRLNVAITRARYRTTVVCSFRPDALVRAGDMRSGVRKLHEYLAYCDRGGEFVSGMADHPDRTPESPFEQAVRDALRSRGYEVESQVGVSQYRIDLAVVDPDDPRRFLVGIECDGATYHQAPAARDRDRLRQEVLERLGWTIHRIWSTDWVNCPDAELERLVQRIEKERRARRSCSATRTPKEASGSAHRAGLRSESDSVRFRK